jgi:hypothetical protein
MLMKYKHTRDNKHERLIMFLNVNLILAGFINGGL